MRSWCKTLGLLVLAAALLMGCAHGQTDFEGEAVYQVSAIDSLLAGDYDGQVTLAELIRHGDTGLGTFQSLDGEMIVLDGQAYQARADGKIYRPGPQTTTPFASVFNFQTTRKVHLEGPLDLAGLQAALDRALPTINLFYGVRITATFERVKARSVPAQATPYPTLAEVVKNQQAVFQFDQVRGTMVGLRCPEFVKGLNVPGYHFHFIDEARQRGGHVLDVRVQAVDIEVSELARLAVVLPREGSFLQRALGQDKSTELKTVEKGR